MKSGFSPQDSRQCQYWEILGIHARAKMFLEPYLASLGFPNELNSSLRVKAPAKVKKRYSKDMET